MNKLRWRCRRGTLELDLMLIRYLERRYAVADAAEQAAFRRLLEFEDTELMQHLMGEAAPAPQGLSTIIAEIRHLPV